MSRQLLSQKYDVVVIGSGAGGGVVADTLLKKNPGMKLLILEAGPYRTKETFNQREADMSGIYFDRGATFSSDMGIAVAAAQTVGGSTAVYTGVSFRPPDSVLQNWRDTHGLNFLTSEYVNTVLDEIEKDICVHEMTPEWDNDNNKLFRGGCEKLGIPVKRLRINTKGCKEQGFCNLGCTEGAKKGTLEVQIPRALKKGAKLITNARVSKVGEQNIFFEIKNPDDETLRSELSDGLYEVYAQKIVLCAGSLRTPVLLQDSQKELGIKNKNIGRYITLHPAYNVHAILDRTIKNYRGFPKTLYTDAFSESDDYYLETSFYYPGVTSKNIPGFGESHREMMLAYDKMMSILILHHDKARYEARVKSTKDGFRLDYPIDAGIKNSMAKALRKSARIFFAAGCKKVALPMSQRPILTIEDEPRLNELIHEKYFDSASSPLSSAHPQGGARMGNNPEHSVVDANGKIFGTKNVYVADASLFPDSVHVNPYETVMLLAHHVAENLF